MTKKRDIYYEKYFPHGKYEGYSENHELNISLNDEVTKDDLIKAGFVFVEGKEGEIEEDADDYDFFVYDEEGHLGFSPLPVPLNGDYGIEQEDLEGYDCFEGMKILPDGWEKDVPELIGLKPEWVDAVTFDG